VLPQPVRLLLVPERERLERRPCGGEVYQPERQGRQRSWVLLGRPGLKAAFVRAPLGQPVFRMQTEL
jgi:hypothetical protein